MGGSNFNTSTSFGRIGAGGFKTWLRRLSRWPQLVSHSQQSSLAQLRLNWDQPARRNNQADGMVVCDAGL